MKLEGFNAIHKATLQDEKFISKNEILSGISEALTEMKECDVTGRKLKTAEELLDEL